MTRNGDPIAGQRVRLIVETGIEYGILIPGLVPPYEEREACIFAGYTMAAWRLLGWMDKADAVAHFRLHHAIRLHSEEAQTMQMNLDARRNAS